ncbi:MAG: hypothetical protein K8F91_19340 [Candidatus Obscuribacterales bacterium]|nr:hypothetical protein [Candidatus Obscuribacterales bacterium]
MFNYDRDIPRIIYLHGFASNPTSNKARFFAKNLKSKGYDVLVADLNQPLFEMLTLRVKLS